jgi:acetyl esterase/lipase
MNAEPNDDPWNSRQDYVWRRNLYIGPTCPVYPLVSPSFGELEGLPAVHVEVGTADRLLDDARQFVSKAQTAGVDARLHATRGAVHCFALHVPDASESRAAMTRIARFLNRA